MTAEKNKASALDHDHPGQGILLTIIAGFVLSGMDAINKIVMTDVPLAQVVWGRYFFHAIIVFTVFSVMGGFDFIKTRAPVLQTVRGFFLLTVTATLYLSIQTVPLADATAVMFFAPVLVTALAGLVLGERVGWLRYGAVVVGFIGVLIIVRPGTGAMDPNILYACAAALALALYVITTRQLQGRDNERTTLFHSTALGAVILSLIMPFIWVSIELWHLGLLALAGTLGAVGHFMWIKALHVAPASTLAPFLNTQLVAAALYSVMIFGDPLTMPFVMGALLIVGAGLFIWHRERAREKSKGASDHSLSE